jgi:DNA-binding response OmpR family regulator
VKQIIFIDDDALIGQVYQDLLETHGFKVHLAHDGAAALDLVSQVRADLVILDMFLPKVPGLEILRRIRTDPQTATVPVIVFSNSYLQSMVKAAKTAGATRCLTKSDCLPEHLLAVVREVLGSSSEPQAPPAEAVSEAEINRVSQEIAQITEVPALMPTPPVPVVSQAPPTPAAVPSPTYQPQQPPPSAAPVYQPQQQPPPAYLQPSAYTQAPAYAPPPAAAVSQPMPIPQPAISRAATPAYVPQAPAPAAVALKPAIRISAPKPAVAPVRPPQQTPAPPPIAPTLAAFPTAPSNPALSDPASAVAMRSAMNPPGFQFYAIASSAGPAAGAAPRPASSYEQLREAFVNSMPGNIFFCRQRILTLPTLPPAERLPVLLELYRAIHQISSRAGVAGFVELGKMSSALESLIKEFFEESHLINASSLRTISHTVEMLGQMMETPTMGVDTSRVPVCLVVDDDPICRETVVMSLRSVNLPSISVGKPMVALELISENQFGLIFLDVEMPGKNGYEICEEIRRSFLNKQTPVLFVTSLGDFENRARSLISGGTDFIAKPFLPLELGLRALHCFYARKSSSAGERAPRSNPLADF